ncbi:MAG: carbon-nitrogen hydrolase family protein [Rhizobiales bacterium]|nr:carbon-nitrogen hydrolase family protein [Hyphomicrobiales bacterium]
MKVALVQMRSSREPSRNVKEAEALVREAAATGASYVLTPEVSNIFEPDKERLRAIVRSEIDDPMVATFSGLAREFGIHLHAGSVAVKAPDGRIANRSLVFAPDGRIMARYDKIHLFDIDLPNGESYRESATYAPGEQAVMVQLPEARIGLCICYDVRFPRLANAYAAAGADILTYPAAFTVPTGEAHWHVLLRARAIETGSFVLSAAQGGDHDGGKSTYGHSIAITPWGEVVAEAGTEPCVITADINPHEVALARQRIPALRNARDFTLKTA